VQDPASIETSDLCRCLAIWRQNETYIFCSLVQKNAPALLQSKYLYIKILIINLHSLHRLFKWKLFKH